MDTSKDVGRELSAARKLAEFISECTTLFEDADMRIGTSDAEIQSLCKLLGLWGGDYVATTTFVSELDQAGIHIAHVDDLLSLASDHIQSQNADGLSQTAVNVPPVIAASGLTNPDMKSEELHKSTSYSSTSKTGQSEIQTRDGSFHTSQATDGLATGLSSLTQSSNLDGDEDEISALPVLGGQMNNMSAGLDTSAIDEDYEDEGEDADALEDEYDLPLFGNLEIRDENSDDNLSDQDSQIQAEDEAERAIMLLENQPIGVTIDQVLAGEDPPVETVNPPVNLSSATSTDEVDALLIPPPPRVSRPISAPRGNNTLNLGNLVEKGIVMSPNSHEATKLASQSESIAGEGESSFKGAITRSIQEELNEENADGDGELSNLKLVGEYNPENDLEKSSSISRRDATHKLRRSLQRHNSEEHGSSNLDREFVKRNVRSAMLSSQRRGSTGGMKHADSDNEEPLNYAIKEANQPLKQTLRPTSAVPLRRWIGVESSETSPTQSIRKVRPSSLEIASSPAERDLVIDSLGSAGTTGVKDKTSPSRAVNWNPDSTLMDKDDVWAKTDVDQSNVEFHVPVSFLQSEIERIQNATGEFDNSSEGFACLKVSFGMALQLWKQLSERLSQVPISTASSNSGSPGKRTEISPTKSEQTSQAQSNARSTPQGEQNSSLFSFEGGDEALKNGVSSESKDETISRQNAEIQKLKRLVNQERSLREYGLYASRISPEIFLKNMKRSFGTTIAGGDVEPSKSGYAPNQILTPANKCSTSMNFLDPNQIRTKVPSGMYKVESSSEKKNAKGTNNEVLFTSQAVEEALRTQRRLLLDAFPSMQLPGHFNSLLDTEEMLLKLRKESRDEIAKLATKLQAADEEILSLQQSVSKLTSLAYRMSTRCITASHSKRSYRTLLVHLAASTCKARVQVRNRAKIILSRLQSIVKAAVGLDQSTVAALCSPISSLGVQKRASAKDSQARREKNTNGQSPSTLYAYTPESDAYAIVRAGEPVQYSSARPKIVDNLDQIEDLVAELEISFGSIVGTIGQMHATLNAFFTRGLELTRIQTELKEELESTKLALANARLQAQSIREVQAGILPTSQNILQGNLERAQQVPIIRPKSARVSSNVSEELGRTVNPVLSRMDNLHNAICFATGASRANVNSDRKAIQPQSSGMKRKLTGRPLKSDNGVSNPYSQGEAFIASSFQQNLRTKSSFEKEKMIAPSRQSVYDDPELSVRLGIGAGPGASKLKHGVPAGEAAARAVVAIPDGGRTASTARDQWKDSNTGYPGPTSIMTAAISAGVGSGDDFSDSQSLIRKMGGGVILFAEPSGQEENQRALGSYKMFRSAFDEDITVQPRRDGSIQKNEGGKRNKASTTTVRVNSEVAIPPFRESGDSFLFKPRNGASYETNVGSVL